MSKLNELVDKIKLKVAEFEENNVKKRHSMTTVLSHFSQKFERDTNWRVSKKSFTLRADQDNQVVFGFHDNDSEYRVNITASAVGDKTEFNLNPQIIRKHFLDKNIGLVTLFHEAVDMLKMAAQSNEKMFTIVPHEIRPVDFDEMMDAAALNKDALKVESTLLSEINDMRALFVHHLNAKFDKTPEINFSPDLSIEYYDKNITSYGSEPKEKEFDIDIHDEKRGWTNDLEHPRSLRTFAAKDMGDVYDQYYKFAMEIYKTPLINDSVLDIEQKLESQKQQIVLLGNEYQ